jgi:hypothetical protein
VVKRLHRYQRFFFDEVLPRFGSYAAVKYKW